MAFLPFLCASCAQGSQQSESRPGWAPGSRRLRGLAADVVGVLALQTYQESKPENVKLISGPVPDKSAVASDLSLWSCFD